MVVFGKRLERFVTTADKEGKVGVAAGAWRPISVCR